MRFFTAKFKKGYLTVTREIVKFKQQTSEYEIKNTINLYLSQMLNAVIWQFSCAPLPVPASAGVAVSV